MFRSLLPSLLLVALVSLPCMAQPAGPAPQIILTHADTILRSQAGGEEMIQFVGHVTGSQGIVQVAADRVDLYQATNRAVLIGNVKITQPDVTMLGPRVEYDGVSRVASAPSGITILDNGATINAGSGRYYLYDRHAEFQNGVKLEDGKSTLRAATGDYYTDERRAFFTGGVRVDNDSGTITARTLTHWRTTQRSYAIGNVVVTATKQSAQLTGDTIDHRPAEGYTLALGSPRLVQVDTVATGDSARGTRRDTTVITARKLEAFRSAREEYVATDSVRMRREKLEAVAALARFLPKENLITLGPGLARPSAADTVRDSVARRDTTARPPDTAAQAVAGETPPIPGADGRYPVVWYDRSQLTGDTITVALLEKKLRSIDVQHNAFAVSEGDYPERYDQLAGDRLFFDVLRDTIRQVRSEGGASSIYFVYDSNLPNGVNRASGDTIRVAFDAGQASQIRIHGRRTRNEGEYFPEQMVRGQETIFRLQGFRWIGRNGGVGALSGALPKAPAVPDVKPVTPEGEVTTPSRRLR
jgi:lipopolysaccharide export system protein LptA